MKPPVQSRSISAPCSTCWLGLGWQAVLFCTLAGVITSVAAAFLGARMEVGLLRRLFGVLLLYIGARELFAKAPKKEPAEK